MLTKIRMQTRFHARSDVHRLTRFKTKFAPQISGWT